MTIYLKKHLSLILLLYFCTSVFGQDSLLISGNKKEIHFVREISNKHLNKKTGFFKKISDIILGKKLFAFNKPLSIVEDGSKALWISDVGSGNIYMIKADKITLPNSLKKPEDLPKSPVGICKYIDDRMLISDSYTGDILVCNAKDKEKKLFKSGLLQPTGIAYHEGLKEVYVVETKAHRISVFNMNGELIKTIGKRGSSEGEFNYPTFIWLDNLGTLYVIDSLNFRVQIFDKTGTLISVFGKQGDGTGDFARPKGIATDSEGNIYIVDALFHAVQIFDKSGTYLYGFGSQGRKEGQFWMPSGIFIDENDLIYVADSYNSRIQVFELKESK